MSHADPRTLPVTAASTWIAALAAVGFLALGVRAVVSPVAAAAFFGLPLAGTEGAAFVQVFGARNIGLSLVALALIALDARRALAVVFFAAAFIAALDFGIVATHASAVHCLKHLGYVVALAGFGVWFTRPRQGAAAGAPIADRSCAS